MPQPNPSCHVHGSLARPSFLFNCSCSQLYVSYLISMIRSPININPNRSAYQNIITNPQVCTTPHCPDLSAHTHICDHTTCLRERCPNPTEHTQPPTIIYVQCTREHLDEHECPQVEPTCQREHLDEHVCPEPITNVITVPRIVEVTSNNYTPTRLSEVLKSTVDQTVKTMQDTASLMETSFAGSEQPVFSAELFIERSRSGGNPNLHFPAEFLRRIKLSMQPWIESTTNTELPPPNADLDDIHPTETSTPNNGTQRSVNPTETDDVSPPPQHSSGRTTPRTPQRTRTSIPRRTAVFSNATSTSTFSRPQSPVTAQNQFSPLNPPFPARASLFGQTEQFFGSSNDATRPDGTWQNRFGSD